MQRLSRRHVSFADLNLCVVNVRQNLADVAHRRTSECCTDFARQC
jgi:hypothetical protein